MKMKMMAHHAAFLARLATSGCAYEKRDTVSLDDINTTQTKLFETFEAYKKKQDERLAELEKRGSVDPVTDEEFKRIGDEVMGLKQVRDELAELQKKLARPMGGADLSGEKSTPEQLEHREAFIKFLRDPGSEQLKSDLQALEKKEVETGAGGAGGYAVPEIINRRINKLLLETSQLRNIVDVKTVGSKDYKELVQVGGAAYGWVGEKAARAETNTPTLEEVAATFGTLYAYPKATEESLDDIFFDVESWLVQSIIEGFAEGEENAIINGDGVNKPTGLLNGTKNELDDDARSFGDIQYFRSGNAAGIDSADPLIHMIQSLKKGYRRNARFLMNKATVGNVMVLKDGDGNYLWKMGDVKTGQPDKLLGYGINETEEMPDVAANAYPIAFGDFKAAYMLLPLVGFRLLKDEITTPGYVKWYARQRLGGGLKKDEAVRLLRCQAAA